MISIGFHGLFYPEQFTIGNVTMKDESLGTIHNRDDERLMTLS